MCISGSRIEDMLLFAPQSRKYKFAKILIMGGHDVNFRTNSGTSPLMTACEHEVIGEDVFEMLQILSELLESNADVHSTNQLLMYAMHSGCTQNVRLL